MSYKVNCTPIGLELDITKIKTIGRKLKTANVIDFLELEGFTITVIDFKKIIISKLPEEYLALNSTLDNLTPYLSGKIIMVGEDETEWVEYFDGVIRRKIVTHLKGKATSAKHIIDAPANGRKLFLE